MKDYYSSGGYSASTIKFLVSVADRPDIKKGKGLIKAKPLYAHV